MKKQIIFLIGTLLISVIGILAYLIFNQVITIPGLTKANWQYERTIPKVITASSNNEQDAVLGDLSTNKVSVTVTKGAFDQDTEVQLFNPDKVPEVDTSSVETIGAPIELTIGQPTRLNEPAIITFAFDKEKLPSDTQAYQMRVVYFNGTKWDYIKPTTIDMDAGTMTFETYHFSLLGANKFSSDTKVTQQWIHSQALDNKMKDDLNNMSDEVAGKVIDLMLEKMGISDKSIKGQVLADVLKDDSYKEMYDMYQKGDVVGFSQKVALKAGSTIANVVPESVMQGALANISGDASEDVAKVAQAAGYMAEGQYKEAAKIIGEQIADKFLITTAGKIAVEVVDYQIQSWKNSEVEAAYKAYRDGADSYFYGYNVDKGDFNSVWDQMRGVRRQLELEAIAKENKVRTDAGMPELSEKQMDVIRDNVKKNYQQQFAKRQEQEAEIAKEEEKLKKIIDAFDKADFFGGIGPAGLDKGYDLETKLSLVNSFVKKLMRDTGRTNLTDNVGYFGKDMIHVSEMVIAGKFYFSEPDGKKKYAEYLEEHFGIPMYPKLQELSGEWGGNLIINEVSYPEEWKDSEQELEGEGCEGFSEAMIAAALEQMKGKESPITLTLNPTSETSGMMVLNANEDNKDIPFTYENGDIKAVYTQDEAVVTISLTPSKNGESYTASGSLNMNAKDLMKVSGSISVNKQ